MEVTIKKGSIISFPVKTYRKKGKEPVIEMQIGVVKAIEKREKDYKIEVSGGMFITITQ